MLKNIPEKDYKKITRNNTNHYLIRGDSLELLKKIPEESVDLIITDPPYNVGLDYGKFYKDRKNKKDYYQWCENWLKECSRILSKKGSLYLISYPEINARLFNFIENELKLNFRRWITWHYPSNIGHSKRNFTRSQRTILFLTKTNKYTFNREYIIQHYKNPEVSKIKERIKKGQKGRGSYDLLRFLDLIELNNGLIDVIDINLVKNISKDRMGTMKKKDEYHHPCQLPLKLLEILIKVSSNEGNILLDPFAGTFTLSKISSDLKRNSMV